MCAQGVCGVICSSFLERARKKRLSLSDILIPVDILFFSSEELRQLGLPPGNWIKPYWLACNLFIFFFLHWLKVVWQAPFKYVPEITFPNMSRGGMEGCHLRSKNIYIWSLSLVDSDFLSHHQSSWIWDIIGSIKFKNFFKIHIYWYG